MGQMAPPARAQAPVGAPAAKPRVRKAGTALALAFPM